MACGPANYDEYEKWVVGSWKVPTDSPASTQYELDLNSDLTGSHRTFYDDPEYGSSFHEFSLEWSAVGEYEYELRMDCRGESNLICRETTLCTLISNKQRLSCQGRNGYKNEYERLGATESPIPCTITSEGEVCAEVPLGCGPQSDYGDDVFGTSESDEDLTGFDSLIFGLAGDDEITTYSEGSCLVGGEGNDTLRTDYEPINSTEGTDILIGGSGVDTFVLSNVSASSIPVLFDFASEDILRVVSEVVLQPENGADFYVVVDDFSGESSALAGPGVHAIYDPTTRFLYWDEDGSEEGADPLPIALLGADASTPSAGQFTTGPLLD